MSSLITKFYSWHVVFFMVVFVALFVIILSFFIIPPIPKGKKPKLIEQFYILKTIPLIKVYFISIFSFAGVFTFVSYMSKTLEFHHLSTSSTSIALLSYGIACFLGNILGGKLTSKIGVMKSLTIIITCQTLFFGLFFFTNDSLLIICLNLSLMGLTAFGIIAPTQYLTIKIATKYIPNSLDSAMGLYISSCQIGIAVGAIVRALTIDKLNIQYTTLSSALLFFISLISTFTIKESKISKVIA